MKTFGRSFLLFQLLLLAVHPHSHAAPAAPDSFRIKQPDGAQFSARNMGDEWSNWTETEQGYSIAQATDGYWYYMTEAPSANGPSAAPGLSLKTNFSPVPAHEAPPSGLKKHIHQKKNEPMPSLESSFSIDPASAYGEAGSSFAFAKSLQYSSSAPVGTFNGKILFILAEFNDRAGTYPATSYAPYITNNIADYYNKASYGRVTLTSANETHGTANDGVIGWINISSQLAAIEAALGLSDQSGNHPNTGSNSDQYNRILAKAAIQVVDQYINYAAYDANGDGYVTSDELAIVIIVAGYEASSNNPPSPSVWGHAWSIDSSDGYPVVDGKTVGKYQSSGQGYSQFGEIQGDHQATMGVMVHELGHQIFDFPDLYNTDDLSAGIGYYDVMAAGAWGKSSSDTYSGATPALPSAWTKAKAGWVDVATASGSTSIIAAGSASANSLNSVYKLPTNSSNEYFLVENRQHTGYDRGLERINNSIGGLAIWHIDDSKTSNTTECYPPTDCSTNHYWVSLEQADGQYDLEKDNNSGDTGDLYPGSTNNTSFAYGSTPSSSLYNSINSGVSVTSISAAGNIMTAIFDMPPTGAISINNGATYTKSTLVTLTLSCTDTNSCSQMKFSNDNFTWSIAESYATSKAWTLSSSNGTKTVYVKFKDASGNWSTAYSDTIILDTIAPVVNAGGNRTVNAGFTQTGTATDANAMNYSWTKQAGPGTITTITFGTSNAMSTTVSASADGTYILRLTATDGAGNSAYSDMTLKWDTTAVVITNVAPVSSSIITNATVSYMLSEQASSGKATFTRTGGTVDLSSPRIYTFKASDLAVGQHSINTNMTLVDGAFYTVSFNAIDLAGNAATTISNVMVYYDANYGKGPTGSVDNSGPSTSRVDGFDLIKLSVAFGSKPGDANWNPACDLDKTGSSNNYIDGLDLAVIGAHFGEVQ